RGNPKMTPDLYGEQKEREAKAAAAVLGADVRFGPWRDGEIPDDEEARRWTTTVIREVRPTLVITHWKKSMHKDHGITSAVVRDAVLLASLEGVAPGTAVWRGVRSVWFAENWEDAESFAPFVYADVTGAVTAWREAVTKYEFVRGGISSFAYLDYYSALFTLRGAESRKGQAVAFDIEPYGKRRVVDDVP
ncbi:MAG: PIG-L family deacetylase, partial [Thermoanaerobaculia bacterium]